MALIEVKSESRKTEGGRESERKKIVNNRQRHFYNKQTGSHRDRRIDQSVINT